MTTNAKVTEETDNTENETEVIEYLLDLFKEMGKIIEATDESDTLSLSYANAKQIVLLKTILQYMDKHQITDKALREDLTSMVESLEHDINKFNKWRKSELIKKDKIPLLLFRRETVSEAMRIGEIVCLLLSLLQVRLKELVTEANKKEALERQGKKLKELLDKQKKESEEKITQYVS
ncbi:MAG: hypothetical protein JSV12_00045 [Candidatus Bathyarchaeota archaeon]|nr:MAG: hypothetical protein JSV12_00045 [Candidatus Bathyarchaeota archaeon]